MEQAWLCAVHRERLASRERLTRPDLVEHREEFIDLRGERRGVVQGFYRNSRAATETAEHCGMEVQDLHHRFNSARRLQLLLHMGTFRSSLCAHFLPNRQDCRHSADETRDYGEQRHVSGRRSQADARPKASPFRLNSCGCRGRVKRSSAALKGDDAPTGVTMCERPDRSPSRLGILPPSRIAREHATRGPPSPRCCRWSPGRPCLL